jgi:hypothetical protein
MQAYHPAFYRHFHRSAMTLPSTERALNGIGGIRPRKARRRYLFEQMGSGQVSNSVGFFILRVQGLRVWLSGWPDSFCVWAGDGQPSADYANKAEKI